jgi:hypothetical protein
VPEPARGQPPDAPAVVALRDGPVDVCSSIGFSRVVISHPSGRPASRAPPPPSCLGPGGVSSLNFRAPPWPPRLRVVLPPPTKYTGLSVMSTIERPVGTVSSRAHRMSNV